MRTKSADLMNRIINYIDSVHSLYKRTPTMREISSALNISVSCVCRYITEMTKNGLLVNNGKSRGVVTEKMNKQVRVQEVPVVGEIACGTPILAEENIESYMSIPNELLGFGKHFILRAKGNSMINAGISNGDLVVIQQQNSADFGQIIVALVGDEATLKRYMYDSENKKIILHPENDEMEDLVFDYNSNIIIQGVAIKVIKNLEC